MTPVAIALGSNVGDSIRYIREAVDRLREVIDLEAASDVYKTKPMYLEDQPPFLNAAVVGSTSLGPRALLRSLKGIESEIGRLKAARYGPREIDLDLIAYGSLQYAFDSDEKSLVIPHPKTVERRFVLLPLCDVAPNFHLAGLGRACDLLEQTNHQAGDVLRLEYAPL